MALHLPQLTAQHMPIVKTAQINELIAKKTQLLDDAAVIQHEINRLTDIEQRKVLRAYERMWKQRGINKCKKTVQVYARILDERTQELAECYSLLDGMEIKNNEGEAE